MRSIKLLIAALASTALLTAPACKKDETASDETEQTDETGETAGKATEGGETGETAGETEGTDEAGQAAGATMSREEAAEKSIQMMEAMATVLEENKDDCAKMAEGIQKIAEENKDFIAQAGAYKGDEEFKKFYQEKYGDKMQELQKKFGPAMAKCGGDEQVQAAMKALSGEG